MWGDPERASRIVDSSDPLVSILFQITGPAHIPWQDSIWQELLHGYNVWVHVPETSILYEKIITNAPRTSNLAALTIHVTQLLNDFTQQIQSVTISHNYNNTSNGTTAAPTSSSDTYNNNNKVNNANEQVMAFSNRISLVGKARALAGGLNLLRILSHTVIAHYSNPNINTTNSQQQQRRDSFASDLSMNSSQHSRNNNNNNNYNLNISHRSTVRRTSSNRSHATTDNTNVDESMQHIDKLKESFCYKCRDDGTNRDVGYELLNALLNFITTTILQQSIPELYDCVTIALQLIITLLSTQLYQPMQSSFQKQQQQHNNNGTKSYNFWNFIMDNHQQHLDNPHHHHRRHKHSTKSSKIKWNARIILDVLIKWQIHRPIAPEKSIQYHHYVLTKEVLKLKGDKIGSDGMYETHTIVQACMPTSSMSDSSATNASHGIDGISEHSVRSATTASHNIQNSASAPLSSLSMSSHYHYQYNNYDHHHHHHNAFLDATRGVLVMSSKIILLPIRLVSLALGLWGIKGLQHQSDSNGYYKNTIQQHFYKRKSRTRDVMFLSTSPIADLSTSLILLLTNNNRASERNPFRMELARLADNRWEGNELPDLPDPLLGPLSLDDSMNQSFHNSFLNTDDDDHEQEEKLPLVKPVIPAITKSKLTRKESAGALMVNFEALFNSFGITVHTEPGALLLYTMLQSSTSFANSIAVRSDLDTLVLPLLRTLYFATSMRHHVAQDYSSNTNNRRVVTSNDSSTNASVTTSNQNVENCPFRSQSQLYVIIILLLLLSQDASFGADAFRRVMVSTVPWYKERYLKEISLGSVLILSLLRCLSFNLNRQHDAFLLSNCCAVLMNLSSSIVDLHDYAAMRLASLTVSAIKRYIVLRKQNPNNDENDLSTPTSMHAEASRTLLSVLKHCLAAKNIEKNLHLVYALVYHQADFRRMFATKANPFRKSEIERVQVVVATAAKVIEEDGNARTAAKALKVLSKNIDQVKEAASDQKKRNEVEDFTFTYEEERDPEIFFVPYVWEVIVCVVTSSSIEWDKDRIQVFPILPEEEVLDDDEADSNDQEITIPHFAQDVSDVV